MATSKNADPRPQAAVPAVVDEHAGQGGSYVIEDGVRRLVERTQPADDVPTTNEGN